MSELDDAWLNWRALLEQIGDLQKDLRIVTRAQVCAVDPEWVEAATEAVRRLREELDA